MKFLVLVFHVAKLYHLTGSRSHDYYSDITRVSGHLKSKATQLFVQANSLFRLTSKKTPEHSITGPLCRNPLITSGFLSQRCGNTVFPYNVRYNVQKRLSWIGVDPILWCHIMTPEAINQKTPLKWESDIPRLLWKDSLKLFVFYPRPVLAFGYCRCLRLSVCVCVSVCLSVCVSITCLSVG